jgi:hypothetical protein
VHPRRSHRAKIARTGTPARIEALMLGLTFVELVLLRLFGYSGMYDKRWGGDTIEERRSAVPWA